MKFIHAGDVHLGNPFVGLDSNMPADFQQLVRSATLTAFQKMIQVALTKQVDFVLFPGDLYHGQRNSPIVQDQLRTAFLQLQAAQIPVYLSFGNHDFQADQQPHLAWPDNVHVFPQAVTTYSLLTKEGLKIGLTGFSYQDQRQTKSIMANFPLKDSSYDYQIGLYHGSLGSSGSNYAAFKLSDLLAKNYDYWALGHIHVRQILYEYPYVAYSGNLQGLNAKETGPKGFYLVEAKNNQLIPEFTAVAPVIWQELAVNQLTEIDDLLSRLNTLQPNQPTLLTIRLQGPLPTLLQEAFNSGLLLDKARQAVSQRLWIVKITLDLPNVMPRGDVNIDDRVWQKALNQVLQPANINKLLGGDLPVALREFFLSQAGQATLKQAMQAQLVEEDHHEN